MKNTLLRPKLRYIIIFLCLFLMMTGCADSVTPGNTTIVAPVVLVIGEDLSQTFNQNAYLQKTHIELLCKSILRHKGGGKIILMGIGNSTPKGHLSCIFKPQQLIDMKNPTPSAKRMNKNINEKILSDNQEKMDVFLAEVDQVLEKRNQSYTDLNGFLSKANLLLSDPDNEDAKKYLFINSDGKQSTKNSSKINCSLKPGEIDGFFVSGWSTKTNCNPDHEFLSPNEFVIYFKNHIKSVSSN